MHGWVSRIASPMGTLIMIGSCMLHRRLMHCRLWPPAAAVKGRGPISSRPWPGQGGAWVPGPESGRRVPRGPWAGSRVTGPRGWSSRMKQILCQFVQFSSKFKQFMQFLAENLHFWDTECKTEICTMCKKMQKICSICKNCAQYAQHAQHATNIQQICNKYATNMQQICSLCRVYILIKYAKYAPGTCWWLTVP